MPAPGPLQPAERLAVFPALHKVAGRTVLVVGDGEAALAKLRLLAQTEARVVVIAPHPGRELAEAAARSGAAIQARPFAPDDLAGAALAFAATGDAHEDACVAAAARAAGVPVNVVDRPELCDFYTPALVNRAPLAVAICSAGTGPVLARHVRARIEALLPPHLGRLARIADGFRATVAERLPTPEGRRRFWARFFDGPVARAILAGREADGRRAAARLLDEDAGASGEENGFVWLVGAGPGAEDLLTLRAQRVLQEADVIVHDGLVPEAVVAMGRREAERIAVGKAKGRHSATQAEINAILVREGTAGRRVVRLKGGDPLIFGRAGEELAALRAAGIPYEVVPGVTAAFAAAASSAIPLTLRGVASSLVFATGHGEDGSTLPGWTALALSGATVAVYMGRSVAAAIAPKLIEAGLAPTTPVAAIENAARSDERVFAGRLADLPGLAGRGDVGGPVLILIGEAVAHGDLAAAEPLAASDAMAA